MGKSMHMSLGKKKMRLFRPPNMREKRQLEKGIFRVGKVDIPIKLDGTLIGVITDGTRHLGLYNKSGNMIEVINPKTKKSLGYFSFGDKSLKGRKINNSLRGKGIGSIALKYIEVKLAEQGIGKHRIETFKRSALNFFLRNGYYPPNIVSHNLAEQFLKNGNSENLPVGIELVKTLEKPPELMKTKHPIFVRGRDGKTKVYWISKRFVGEEP